MKILIVKPSSFGHIIQASPILQAIKSKWKDSLIDWLVFKQWKQVVELFPNVNNIKCWDRKGGNCSTIIINIAVIDLRNFNDASGFSVKYVFFHYYRII
jgi:hypothetical protein